MNMSSKKRALYSVLVSCLAVPLHAIKLMHANVDVTSEIHATFAQPLEHALFTSGGTLYTACAGTGALQYTLSGLSPDKDFFAPLVAQKLLPSAIIDTTKPVNKEELKDNPLFNAAVAYLGLLNAKVDLPVVVVQQDKHRVYILDKFPRDDTQYIHDSGLIYDALPSQTPAQIVGLATTKNQPQGFVFLAVKPTQGIFGDLGSGIAVIRIFETKKKKETVTPDGKKQETEIATLSLEQTCAQANDEKHVVRAAALDRTSACLKIGNDLSSIDPIVAMTYDVILNRLFVALRVQTGNHHQDGACALLVGHVTPLGQLLFQPFAPDIFTSDHENEIIGAKGAQKYISLHHVDVMHTSTLLPYLILVGGNGDSASTQRCVYTLPIADTRHQADQSTHALCGTLASKHAQPRELFSDTTKALVKRVLEETASSANDIYTSDDTIHNAPAQVGGGPLPYGDITRLYVKRDGVYALVGTADPGKTAGVFFSQALFDARGKIKSWTAWQRVTGAHYGVTALHVNDATGECTLVVKDGMHEVRNVVRTQWGAGFEQGYAPLTAICAQLFPQESGGIHGLYNAHQTTPGLGTLSLLLILGHDALSIVQTGSGYGSDFRPLTGDDLVHNNVICTQGQLTQFKPTRFLTIQGGILNELGPLVTAQCVRGGHDSADGYLFVGGAGGLGVLRNPNGTGWDAVQGLRDYLQGLSTDMRFTRIGSYRFVHKLIHDDHYLYVLTPTCLDRIDLSDPAFPATRLATPDTIAGLTKQDRFFDIIASHALILVGTTNGLVRIGNGADARHAHSVQECAWTPVVLPNSQGATLQVTASSPTHQACDVARGAGGMVYALTGHRGRNTSRVYRIAIAGTEHDGVTQDTVQLINDKKNEDTLSSFIPLCAFRNIFATDGVMKLRSRDKDMYTQPTVIASALNLLPLPLEHANQITAIERNAASGIWMIAGDFGLLVHE